MLFKYSIFEVAKIHFIFNCGKLISIYIKKSTSSIIFFRPMLQGNYHEKVVFTFLGDILYGACFFTACFAVFQSVGGRTPIYFIPKLIYIFGTAVLLIKVIGVFPHIANQYRVSPKPQRIIGVGSGKYLQFTIAIFY